MSGADPWTPVHHEDADEPTPAPAPKPREAKPKDASSSLPSIAFTLAVPPEVMQQLYALGSTMERLADEIAIQGKVIQELAEAISRKDSP